MNTKLGYQNDWENDTYFVDGKKIKDLTLVSIQGKDYEVHSRNTSVPVVDMGRQYKATSKHYFVFDYVFGVMTEVDLRNIVRKVDIYALQYTLM